MIWDTFSFQAGPVIYRSRTVFEDATPELVRDFFWDDDFRPKWDPMLSYFKTLEEFPVTGEMIVHWIKKVMLYPEFEYFFLVFLYLCFVISSFVYFTSCIDFCYFCYGSSLSSAVIENTSWAEEYGSLQKHFIVSQRFDEIRINFFLSSAISQRFITFSMLICNCFGTWVWQETTILKAQETYWVSQMITFGRYNLHSFTLIFGFIYSFLFDCSFLI